MRSPDLESPWKTTHNHIRNIPIRPYPIYHENAPPYTLWHTSQSSNPCYSWVNCNAGYGNSHSTFYVHGHLIGMVIFVGYNTFSDELVPHRATLEDLNDQKKCFRNGFNPKMGVFSLFDADVPNRVWYAKISCSILIQLKIPLEVKFL